MTCEKCGFTTELDNVKCPSCTEVDLPKVTCPNCGALHDVLTEGEPFSFCTVCGYCAHLKSYHKDQNVICETCKRVIGFIKYEEDENGATD